VAATHEKTLTNLLPPSKIQTICLLEPSKAARSPFCCSATTCNCAEKTVMISARTFQWSGDISILCLYGTCNYVLLTYRILHNKEIILDWSISFIASDVHVRDFYKASCDDSNAKRLQLKLCPLGCEGPDTQHNGIYSSSSLLLQTTAVTYRLSLNLFLLSVKRIYPGLY
jgi:hypothetical protein